LNSSFPNTSDVPQIAFARRQTGWLEWCSAVVGAVRHRAE
jgi:hypothetical protein